MVGLNLLVVNGDLVEFTLNIVTFLYRQIVFQGSPFRVDRTDQILRLQVYLTDQVKFSQSVTTEFEVRKAFLQADFYV